jgi:hypothetical protein
MFDMLVFVGMMLAGLFVFFLARSLLRLFRWHVLGITPAILDEELVSKTAEKFAQMALLIDKVQAVRDKREFTQEQQQTYLEHVRKVFRSAIEDYIENYMQKA